MQISWLFLSRRQVFMDMRLCGLGGVLSMFGGPVKIHSNTQQEC